MEDKINIQEIIKIMPHRYPFLLVDRILQIDEGKSAIGLKNVTMNEPQFTGHFPDSPVMPGVLIIEAMAQVAGILAAKSIPEISIDGRLMYFMSIESAKFRKIVSPGDSMYLHVNIEKNRGDVWRFSAFALVEEQKVAESLFTAVIR